MSDGQTNSKGGGVSQPPVLDQIKAAHASIRRGRAGMINSLYGLPVLKDDRLSPGTIQVRVAPDVYAELQKRSRENGT